MAIEFNFQGFEPNLNLKSYAESAMKQIFDLAPDGAHVIGVLKKEGKQFFCSFDVHSPLIPFVATVTELSPVAALASAEDKVKRLIASWKKYRFTGTGESRGFAVA